LLWSPLGVASMVKTGVAEFSLMVGLGRFGAGFGLVGLVVLSGGLASSALADSFYLKNGRVIEGSIVKGTLNTLTLQSGGSVELASISQIERVVLKLADGSELAGELLGWTDGVYELRSADQVLRVTGGEVLEDQAAATETASTPAPTESVSVETPTETIAMRSLPSFTLKNGDTLVGKILHATGSVLTIRPSGGSALPISRAQIETVTFESETGEVISGRLLSWEGGVYRLQIDDRELLANLPDDAAKAPSPALQAVLKESVDAPLDTPVAAEIEQADAAILPSSDTEQPEKNLDEPSPAEVGVGGPANEIAVASVNAEEETAEPVAGAADGQHLIETLVDPVDEDGQSVVFKFQLSKPATRPLVVLYAATEASAKAGEDFEAKSGVITFATGSTYAEVQVPIIDDDQGEDSEVFNLFLSGDPETITFSERQIAVTINDND